MLPSEDLSEKESGSGNSVHARTVQTFAVFPRLHAEVQAPSIILQDPALSSVVVREGLRTLCSAEVFGNSATSVVFVETSSGSPVHCRRASAIVAVKCKI